MLSDDEILKRRVERIKAERLSERKKKDKEWSNLNRWIKSFDREDRFRSLINFGEQPGHSFPTNVLWAEYIKERIS